MLSWIQNIADLRKLKKKKEYMYIFICLYKVVHLECGIFMKNCTNKVEKLKLGLKKD